MLNVLPSSQAIERTVSFLILFIGLILFTIDNSPISVSACGYPGADDREGVECPEPSETPSPQPSRSPSPKPSRSPSPQPSHSPSPKPSRSPSPSPTATPTPSPSPTDSPSPSPTGTPTPSPEVSPSPNPTPTPTISPSPSATPTQSPTPTPTPEDDHDDDKDDNSSDGRGGSNLDNTQASVAGATSETPPPTGQVLGATTLAATGAFDQQVALAFMALSTGVAVFGSYGLLALKQQ